MPTFLNASELRARFSGQKKSLIYDEAVKQYFSLKIHADGDMPIWLIKNQRPNESDEVRSYREKIYEPETENPIARVLSLLEKIRRSPDWMIRFPKDVPTIINAEETLEQYMSKRYPVYDAFENWLFEEALRTCAIDVNAVIAIIPQRFEIAPTEYLQPVAHIFNSNAVVDFVADDYCVLKSEDLSSLLTVDEQVARLNNIQPVSMDSNENFYVNFNAGQVYWVIDTLSYQKWEVMNDGKYRLTLSYRHGLRNMPAFKVPGKFVKRVGNNVLKKSPLRQMVPHLNKAARESNDLDAGVIMHLYLEKWRIDNSECKKCKGVGEVPTSNGVKECTTCKGTGRATGKSPFNEVVVKMATLGQANVPVPPLGYVEKNTDILKLQDERVEKHIYRALEAVNMEHLADIQLNQSGTAKEYDRDEMNSTVYSFAESICNIANLCAYYFNELRNSGVVQNEQQRKELLPYIPVPEKFDIINSTALLTEYSTAKTAGLSSIILSELQRQIAQKKFYDNPDVASFVQMVMDLDPFPDKSTEEKALLVSSGLATKEDVILSSYIADFVKQAVEENAGFEKKSNKEKRTILLAYAKEKVQSLSDAAQVQQDILGNNNNPQQQQKKEEQVA